MKRRLFLISAIVSAAVLLGFAAGGEADHPAYNAQSQLLRPQNYREWIFLSSGLGMNYGPGERQRPQFTNVFVPQWAYREFQKSGKWPEQTIFVVEERNSETQGSINQAGRFQTDFAGIGVEVKDSKRFPDKWAYFAFRASDVAASARPKPDCWQCHEDHAAAEHSFVQFYPTLKSVAQKFGTYKAEAEKPVDTPGH